MDDEEMILDQADQDRDQDHDEPYDNRIETRFFCFIDFAYRDCTECNRQCYIIDRNKRRKNHGNNH